MARHVYSLILLILAHFAMASESSSSCCGNPPDFAGSSRNFTIQSGGRTRHYLLHLPSSYRAGQMMPLMLAFHGAGGEPTEFERTTRLSEDKINPGVITVYPAGIKGSWEGPSYATPGVDDKAFTAELVDELKKTYCVDETRIYAVGKSNGGGFVNTLACSPVSSNFAAVAIVAGAMYDHANASADESCRPGRLPLPLLEIHATGDKTIPYNGGEGRGGSLPSIPGFMERIQGWSHKWPTRESGYEASHGVVEFLLAHRKRGY
ncbi:hypothetical protein CDD80_413 [Ophiocordyceps camponoti-rufipedis]|uniref:feruloyl esterase n=1 Tax=Ophiocordyceps camponoti-rufipedis TaxID=2004952 RepID=A0A2C5XPT9_9HYPO|nr:hypothetical protein CDD80_413 [Ophiocordyceps camponoti-rufipedis]